MTVGEYLQWWLDNEAAHNVSPKTLQVYRYIADKHIVPTLGACQLAKFQSLHIQNYCADKLNGGRLRKPRYGGEASSGGGLSAQFVRHHDRLLNVALKRARALKLISHNPVEDVKRPKVADREIEILDDDEIATLLDAAAGTRLYGPIFLAVTTGLRRGEILGLRWQDISFDRATLSVCQSLEQTREGLRIKSPKTKKSRRVVTLPTLTIEIVRDHRRHQAEERLALGLGKSNLIFTELDGGFWPPDKLSRQFGLIVKAAKLRGVTFHELRHTHITNLLREGVHPKIASERAGHSSVAITLDIYSHAVQSLQEDAALRVDIAMRKALKGRTS